jgi:hypothetical protein
MSTSEPDDRSRSGFPDPEQVTTDSRNTVLVIADAPPDTTIRPSRHPIWREWPRPRMPKPPEPPKPQ